MVNTLSSSYKEISFFELLKVYIFLKIIYKLIQISFFILNPMLRLIVLVFLGILRVVRYAFMIIYLSLKALLKK